EVDCHIPLSRLPLPEAFSYFRQGLGLFYGYNLQEAKRSFTTAAAIDPSFALSWWGVGLSLAPHFNLPVCLPDAHAEALDALERALSLVTPNDAIHGEMIRAQMKRFSRSSPANRDELDQTYCDEMRLLWRKYPDNPDI